MRDIMLRDVLGQAFADADGAPMRRRVREIWRSTLDLWFLVEPQPDPSHTLAIDRIEPSGQAIPKVAIEYPAYFAECVERLTGFVQRHVPEGQVKHLGSIPTAFHWLGNHPDVHVPRRRLRRLDAAVSRPGEPLRALDLGLPVGVEREPHAHAGGAGPPARGPSRARGSGKTLMALEYPPRTGRPGCYTDETNVD
jgi:hypothetical protein